MYENKWLKMLLTFMYT